MTGYAPLGVEALPRVDGRGCRGKGIVSRDACLRIRPLQGTQEDYGGADTGASRPYDEPAGGGVTSAQRQTGGDEQPTEDEQGAPPEQGAEAVRRSEGGPLTCPTRRDRHTERRPRIKRVWPAHYHLDVPRPRKTEERVVEHVGAIPMRRGEDRACTQVGVQRLQTQLDL